MLPFIISMYSNSLMHAYRYVVIGNKPFLMSYNGHFEAFVLPTVLNIQEALVKANLATQIKIVVPAMLMSITLRCHQKEHSDLM